MEKKYQIFISSTSDAPVSREDGFDDCFPMAWDSQLEAIQIYAHADAEHKGRAIANATPKDNPLYSERNLTLYTVTVTALI